MVNDCQYCLYEQIEGSKPVGKCATCVDRSNYHEFIFYHNDNPEKLNKTDVICIVSLIFVIGWIILNILMGWG